VGCAICMELKYTISALWSIQMVSFRTLVRSFKCYTHLSAQFSSKHCVLRLTCNCDKFQYILTADTQTLVSLCVLVMDTI